MHAVGMVHGEIFDDWDHVTIATLRGLVALSQGRQALRLHDSGVTLGCGGKNPSTSYPQVNGTAEPARGVLNFVAFGSG
jgi:hypothetical protein